jgi:hypothetical protein
MSRIADALFARGLKDKSRIEGAELVALLAEVRRDDWLRSARDLHLLATAPPTRQWPRYAPRQTRSTASQKPPIN